MSTATVTRCSGLQCDRMDFFKPAPGVVFACDTDRPAPADMVTWHNVGLFDNVSIDVIDIVSLVRDMPDELVEVLFYRQFVTFREHGEGQVLFAMAEPCPETGETLFRGHTNALPLTQRAHEALAHVLAQAPDYATRVLLAPGQSIAVDNRRTMVHFCEGHTMERRFTYTTLVGDDFPDSDEEKMRD